MATEPAQYCRRLSGETAARALLLTPPINESGSRRTLTERQTENLTGGVYMQPCSVHFLYLEILVWYYGDMGGNAHG